MLKAVVLLVAALSLLAASAAFAQDDETSPSVFAAMTLKGLVAIDPFQGRLVVRLGSEERNVVLSADAGTQLTQGSAVLPFSPGPWSVRVEDMSGREVLFLTGDISSAVDGSYSAKLAGSRADLARLSGAADGAFLTWVVGHASGNISASVALLQECADCILVLGIDSDGSGQVSEDEKVSTPAVGPGEAKAETSHFQVLPPVAAYNVRLIRGDSILAISEGVYDLAGGVLLKGGDTGVRESALVGRFKVDFVRTPSTASLGIPLPIPPAAPVTAQAVSQGQKVSSIIVIPEEGTTQVLSVRDAEGSGQPEAANDTSQATVPNPEEAVNKVLPGPLEPWMLVLMLVAFLVTAYLFYRLGRGQTQPG